MRKTLTILSALALLATPAFAQDAMSPEGNFVDSYGTSFHFELCGDGTELCGTLTNIEGASATPENEAYVNQQVVAANQTAENTWEGTVIFDGKEAAAKVTQVSENTIEIQGCRAMILCQTLTFNRS